MNLSIERALWSSRTMKSLTGLCMVEFESLVPVFERLLFEEANSKDRKRAVGGGGKSILIDARHKLFYILFYMKVYPTYDLAGFMFRVVRSACCMWTKRYLPILEKALGRKLCLPAKQICSMEEFARKFPGLKDVFIDGTERPIQRPKKNKTQRRTYSGKKKRNTRKNMVISDEKKKILVMSETRNGKIHDMRQLIKNGSHRNIPPGVSIWADKAYQGLKKYVNEGVSVMIPHKKPRGRSLSPEQKEENRIISGIRIVVEHAIGGIKRYKAASDIYRNKKGMDDRLMRVAAGLWNLHLDSAAVA